MRFIVSLIVIALSANITFCQTYIAGFEQAKEIILRGIPLEYIYKARNELQIAYQHTSHGTHVSYGLFGLQDYKAGDDTSFAVTTNNFTENYLNLQDNTLSAYAESGADASDLSVNETAFINATRNYLDDPINANINVIMWSWCSIIGHDVSGNYFPGMDSLIAEYSTGGSKIGSGAGQRINAVTFIFMTGHAELNNNVGDKLPKNQADLITSHCISNNQFCLDYFSIDAHDMSDNYWEDVNDDAYSDAYGGNFYIDYQNSHTLGEHYYENKSLPGGSVEFGEHVTQHITANRKAYAMWWILARIAGWNGITTGETDNVAPSAPTNPTAIAISSSQINISWDAASDNVGVSGYSVFRNGIEITTTASLSFSDKSLSEETLYNYYVIARDAAGNSSASSDTVSATTGSNVDTEAPTAPTNITAIAISSSQINISWDAASDNFGVSGYSVFRDSVEIISIQATTFSDKNLIQGTTYDYQIQAFDFSGNKGPMSKKVSTKTLTSINASNNIVYQSFVSLYPNPTKDIINILILNSALKLKSFKLYDITGSKIDIDCIENKSNEIKVDLSGQAIGLYIYQIFIDDEVITGKINLIK